MSSRSSVVLVGIGGYGNAYLQELLPRHIASEIVLAAVVDVDPSGCEFLGQLHELKIPIHRELHALYETTSADLVIIAAPVHTHADLTCEALAHQSHVLCEKPLASRLEDITRMLEAEAASSARVAIGYQWSFSQAIQRCKRDLMGGLFGEPIRVKTMACSPRGVGYYRRNSWAGRITGATGQRVLDSPLNNAHAHQLHNLLYLLGETREGSDCPRTLQAELYRANDIANYDTVALRCVTERGAELLFFATHAIAREMPPVLHLEFERGVIEANLADSSHLTARLEDGSTWDYGRLWDYPDEEYFNKIWQALEARNGGRPIACGIAASIPHSVCAIAAQESPAAIVQVAPHMTELMPDGSDQMITIRGIRQIFEECFAMNCLPSELPHASLTCPSRVIQIQQEIMKGDLIKPLIHSRLAID